MATSLLAVPAVPLRSVHTSNLSALFTQLPLSLVVSTSQAGTVIFVRNAMASSPPISAPLLSPWAWLLLRTAPPLAAAPQCGTVATCPLWRNSGSRAAGTTPAPWRLCCTTMARRRGALPSASGP
jgi:hypothetical protein